MNLQILMLTELKDKVLKLNTFLLISYFLIYVRIILLSIVF